MLLIGCNMYLWWLLSTSVALAFGRLRDMGITYHTLTLATMEQPPCPTLHEELIELIFDKVLEQYPPDLDSSKTLFTLDHRLALSALTTVSLLAARRTRSHRFKFVLLACGPPMKTAFTILESFLALSFHSGHIKRLLPMSTIATHIKVVMAGAEEWSDDAINYPNDGRVMSFVLRLRNEFRLEQLSWHFPPYFCPSTGFHRRFAGLLLSPTLKAISLHEFSPDLDELQGRYIPGPGFRRVICFGEDVNISDSESIHEAYSMYTNLELGGSRISKLPLPFDIPLPNGSIYRPFAHLRKFVAVDGLPYAVIQSVLRNNDGRLEVLHIGESLGFYMRCRSQRFDTRSLTPLNCNR